MFPPAPVSLPEERAVPDRGGPALHGPLPAGRSKSIRGECSTRWRSRRHRDASGTLVNVAALATTGPATPKHADCTDAQRVCSSCMNVDTIATRSVKSSVENSRTTTGCGRVPVGSKRPRRVLVPPMSPARSMGIDIRTILHHLDVRSSERFHSEAACQYPRPAFRVLSHLRDSVSCSREN